MNIFYIGNKYPEHRCIIGTVDNAKYYPIGSLVQPKNLGEGFERLLISIGNRYACRRGEKLLPYYWFQRRDGIIHTFNQCIAGNSRWIVTFETIIPRTNYTRSKKSTHESVDKLTLKALKLLAKDNCIACIALSNATYKIQYNAMLEMSKVGILHSNDMNKIINKTHVIHPPQRLLISEKEVEIKFEGYNSIEFIFVGHDFFRKGGKEMLTCLSELHERYSFHLTVISNLDYNDYATQSTFNEMEECKSILEKEEWITYYSTLENREVLELCKKAHVGLLPTYADTYGYSVLEMQACGCAMVTTDIRALPEINNTECGWMCHLPQNEYGEAIYETSEQREKMRNILKDELKIVLEEILACDKSAIMTKALRSRRRIEEYHNPKAYAEQLLHYIQ